MYCVARRSWKRWLVSKTKPRIPSAWHWRRSRPTPRTSWKSWTKTTRPGRACARWRSKPWINCRRSIAEPVFRQSKKPPQCGGFFSDGCCRSAVDDDAVAQCGLHFAQRLGLDLTNALGRYAKLVSQIVQGGAAIISQPAGFDDATAAGVQAGQRLLDTFALQRVHGVAFDVTGGFMV